MFGNVYRDDGGVDCPGCGHVYTVSQLKVRHWAADYGTEIEIECKCGHKFTVDVEARPEFSRTAAKPKVPRASTAPT